MVACNPRTGEKEARASETQGHSWLHSAFKPSLGHMRSYLRERGEIGEKKRRRGEEGMGGEGRGREDSWRKGEGRGGEVRGGEEKRRGELHLLITPVNFLHDLN